MLIEDYFLDLKKVIKSYSTDITNVEVETDARTETLGFVKGDIYFNDGTILHFREFLDVEIDIYKGKYVYQYMNQDGSLIFRYDNAPHHQKLNLLTFPDHKHDRAEDIIRPSTAPSLEMVLQEILKK